MHSEAVRDCSRQMVHQEPEKPRSSVVKSGMLPSAEVDPKRTAPGGSYLVTMVMASNARSNIRSPRSITSPR